jgi:hypothetical protein
LACCGRSARAEAGRFPGHFKPLVLPQRKKTLASFVKVSYSLASSGS